MSEYIERNAAIAVINSLKGSTRSPSQNNMIREILVKMDYVPAADVAPVVHGLWIGEGDGYSDGAIVYDVWHCSECDYCIDDGTYDPDLLPNYCPNCGSKMDLEAKNDKP